MTNLPTARSVGPRYWVTIAGGLRKGGAKFRPLAHAGRQSEAVDDYLAFGQMMLSKGKYGSERVLSRPSVELMTTDHLTPEQKALSGLWDSRGWGFGVSMVIMRDDVAAVPGRFGWDGGYGTSWSSDPKEEMVAILMSIAHQDEQQAMQELGLMSS